MDFPGTLHVAWNHFFEYCLDICKSISYHGFKRIILVNGHGSNTPLLEFVGRRAIMETDALLSWFMWWNLLRVDLGFIESFRESSFPGGAGHAGEVETSVYLHLCREKVQMDKAVDRNAWYNAYGASGYQWSDAFGSGPVTCFEWINTFSEDGVFGDATKGTAEKGGRIFEEAVRRLVEYVDLFQNQSKRDRKDYHETPPTHDLPQA